MIEKNKKTNDRIIQSNKKDELLNEDEYKSFIAWKSHKIITGAKYQT